MAPPAPAPAPPPPKLPPPGSWRAWVLGARPRTLPAAVAPVLVGTAAATVGTGGTLAGAPVVWWRFACALVVAVSVQVGTNYANDHADGVRGTDDPGDRVGPPRLVGNGLASPAAVERAALLSFGVTLLAGTPLVLLVSWWLVPVGLAAVAAGWFYTGGPRPYGYAGLGEVFVFVFFGLVATVGSTFVQIETITATAWVAGVAMGCLATALLVVNNLRDIPGDTRAGKQTLAVRIGAPATRVLYVVLLVVPILLVPVMAALAGRPAVALALVAILPGRRAVLPVLEGAGGAGLIAVLARTGMVQVVYGVLLTVGLAVHR